jgi:hypothetical protein
MSDQSAPTPSEAGGTAVEKLFDPCFDPCHGAYDRILCLWLL